MGGGLGEGRVRRQAVIERGDACDAGGCVREVVIGRGGWGEEGV